MSFTPRLTKLAQLQLRNAFEENLGNLVFRRIREVVPETPIYEAREYHFNLEENKEKYIVHRENFPTEHQILHKNWELKCWNYTGETETRPLRKDKVRSSIRFYSEDYAEIDIVGNCTFTFNKPYNKKVMPLVGDIICGTVDTTLEHPTFINWFNCSDQFLRAWTLIMHDTHRSYNNKPESQLKKFVFSGNRLCANTFLKWQMAHRDNGVDLPKEEVFERHYHLRTEFTSKKWVHVYAALVSIIRYGELPCEFNVPTNSNNVPKMTHWNIPGKFITTLLTTWTDLKPQDFGCRNWPMIETMARKWAKKETIYEKKDTPKINSLEDFPGLGKSPKTTSKPLVEWAKILEKVSDSENEEKEDVVSVTGSSDDSWADMAEEDDGSCLSDYVNDFYQDISQKSSNPSEGEHKNSVFVLHVKTPEKKIKTKLYETEVKAKQWILDVTLEKISSLHDVNNPQHTGSFESCEFCQLRKFKLETDLKSVTKKYSSLDTEFVIKQKEIN